MKFIRWFVFGFMYINSTTLFLRRKIKNIEKIMNNPKNDIDVELSILQLEVNDLKRLLDRHEYKWDK